MIAGRMRALGLGSMKLISSMFSYLSCTRDSALACSVSKLTDLIIDVPQLPITLCLFLRTLQTILIPLNSRIAARLTMACKFDAYYLRISRHIRLKARIAHVYRGVKRHVLILGATRVLTETKPVKMGTPPFLTSAEGEFENV